MWYAGSIYILTHSNIFSYDCKVPQDLIIDYTKDSLYLLTSDVLELTCAISSFYVAGGVSFILVPHLCYGGTRVINHDVRIFVIDEVPNIIIEQNSLGNLEYWTLWSVKKKLISIVAVVGHHTILLEQDELKDVG